MDASNDYLEDFARNHNLSILLLAWYSREKRDLPWRKTGDPYAIWVSEVMLQQTQVKTVIPYYQRFLQRFPSVENLGRASLDDVLTEWRGLGYYSRARRMWEGANYLLDQWSGKMPEDYDSLLKVPGIGKYTAGAIASIAFGQRVPAIDGNVLRVVSRLLAWPEPVETVHSYRHFSDYLLAWQPAPRPGDFNQALMELGAMVCTSSKPDCGGCPLIQLCEAHLNDDVLYYPVKKPKAERQIVTRLTFVLRRGDSVYLQKRPSHGLLADMWEFPGVELSQENVLKDCLLNKLGDGSAAAPLPVESNGTVPSYPEWFNYFKKAVSEREFDGQVRNQFEKGVAMHGPVWYTFSHRQWQIIWVIVDLPCPLNLTEQPELEELERTVLREAGEEYQVDPKEVYPLGKSEAWILLQNLGVIALPVAFSSIVDDLSTN